MKYIVYAKILNQWGRDYWKKFGSSGTIKGLYNTIRKIRDDFNDTFKELDKWVYIGDENEERIKPEIKPSHILRKYGTREDIEIDARIRRCNKCYHFIDIDTFKYCKNIGKRCKKFIRIEDYWKKHGMIEEKKDK